MANQPIKKWRVSNIEVCIWDNKKQIENGEVNYKTVTISRSFKKKNEDIWRSEVINNVRRSDIPKLITMLDKAQDFLYFEVQDLEKEKEEGD
ncbi:MAG: hypothetical protein V1815_01590 [Candidatus Woesearchaeota archaeon]